eukprot:scaffold11185_cov205-Amphora_coffeaeformis.AAC.1
MATPMHGLTSNTTTSGGGGVVHPRRKGNGAASTTTTTTTTTMDLLDSHNYIVLAAWLVPMVALLLQPIQATHPVAMVVYAAVTLYAADLAQWRGTFVGGAWCTAVALTLTTAWCRLIETDDEQGGAVILMILLEIFTAGLVYAMAAAALHATAAWTTLATRQALVAANHAVLPPTGAAIGTAACQTAAVAVWGANVTAAVSPWIFVALLLTGMLSLGSMPLPEMAWKNKHTSSSLGQTHMQQQQQQQQQMPPPPPLQDEDDNDKTKKQKTLESHTIFWVDSTVAWGHLALLYMVPLAMYLGTHLRRIVSTTFFTTDDMHEIILLGILPYLMGHYGLTWCHTTGLRPNPYAAHTARQTALVDLTRPAVLMAMAAVSLQQRYLIQPSHAVSYYFFDNASPTWLLSLYWAMAVLSLLFVMAFWGRTSATTNTILLGEYHEDVVQLALSLAGLCLGKAFGLPWNFTPLPVLAFLGLTLWATTRMLRYLTIFLFVVHATGVVVFTYRFAGIDQSLTLPLGVSVSLVRLGLLVTLTSVGAGLVTGLAVRSSGGFGAVWLKRLDVTGWLLVLYVLSVMTLEIALWKRSLPTNELVGVSVATNGGKNVDEPLYDAWWAYGTSVVILATTAFMKRVKIVGSTSAAVAMALSIGKTLSIYVDMAEQGEEVSALTGNQNKAAPGYDVWLRALVTALVYVVLFSPGVFVEPVHVKSSAPRARRHSATSSIALPEGTGRLIAIYIFVFLPCALMVAIPYVVYPIANAIRGDWRGDSYYRVHAPLSELAGSTLLLWGLACLAMLNYYLPDGGGEVWKKLAALVFLMGVGIVFAAPAMGIHIEAASNPYAAISSLGSQLIRKGKGRTGGWGLLAACFATLLAITGPLELKERRTDAVKKDSMLLFRTMVFSLLFGGGVAWFLVMLCMRDASFVFLVLTSVCSLTVAFLGTIAAVLGYFVPLEEFSEVTQVFSIWLIALPILAPISGLPQLFGSSDAHPFGVNGWLSTYLVIGGTTALSFCLSVRSRPNKNPATRGIANTSCILAWLCAVIVLFGRYGVAGMDFNYDVTTVMGLPASVFGTLAIMPILLALEGESSKGNRTTRVTSSTKVAKSSLGINVPLLTTANSWVVLVVATASVFVLASFYAICLRGAGLGNLFGFGKVAKSHEDVFSSIFGSSNSEADEHDLAALAERAISHSQALATSAKLAASGFWTSASFLGPFWHLLGLGAVLPSLGLLVQEKWLGVRIPSSTVVMFLPAQLLPIFLCRGVPTLQAAAAVSCLGGLMQWSVHHQTDYQSKMSI